MPRGKYIVIEGIEAVGKTTVINRLAQELQAAHVPTQVLSKLVQSGNITAQAIQRIADDPRYPVNNRSKVLLHNAAYTQSLEEVQRIINSGAVCIADHGYLSALVAEYYGRGDITNYTMAAQLLQFIAEHTQPDLLILLDAPVSIVKERMDPRRAAGLDEAYLERIRAGYLWEARQRNLPTIYTTEAADVVFARIWEYIRRVMGGPTQPSSAQATQSVTEAPATQVRATPVQTTPATISAPAPQTPASPTLDVAKSSPEGLNGERTISAKDVKTQDHTNDAVTTQGLASYVTDTHGTVYGFTNALSPTTVAAAIVASEQGDSLRTTLIDEFIRKPGTDTQVLKRMTSAGDNSVPDMIGQYLMVEQASQLLTPKLAEDRLATYAKQLIGFDQKDRNGHYRYYIPPELKGKIRSQYIRAINDIFDVYSKLTEKLTKYIRTASATPSKDQSTDWQAATKAQACGALRPLLPVASTSSVGIYASGQALEDLSGYLMTSDLSEARTIGKQILTEAHKAVPLFPQQPDSPSHTNAPPVYEAVGQLAKQLLPATHTGEGVPVTLTHYAPRSELSLVSDILYGHSDLPLAQLQQIATKWPRKRKVDILTAYIGKLLDHNQPELEKVRYTFDLVCDYGTFHDLRRYYATDSFEQQLLSPRLGYDVPGIIEAASVIDEFEHCFDLSLELYATLQASGFETEAQYATLLGHKMRWKATYGVREIFRIYQDRMDSRAHTDYSKIIQAIHTEIAAVHPLLAKAMRFANKPTGHPAQRKDEMRELDTAKTGE